MSQITFQFNVPSTLTPEEISTLSTNLSNYISSELELCNIVEEWKKTVAKEMDSSQILAFLQSNEVDSWHLLLAQELDSGSQKEEIIKNVIAELKQQNKLKEALDQFEIYLLSEPDFQKKDLIFTITEIAKHNLLSSLKLLDLVKPKSSQDEAKKKIYETAQELVREDRLEEVAEFLRHMPSQDRLSLMTSIRYDNKGSYYFYSQNRSDPWLHFVRSLAKKNIKASVQFMMADILSEAERNDILGHIGYDLTGSFIEPGLSVIQALIKKEEITEAKNFIKYIDSSSEQEKAKRELEKYENERKTWIKEYSAISNSSLSFIPNSSSSSTMESEPTSVVHQSSITSSHKAEQKEGNESSKNEEKIIQMNWSASPSCKILKEHENKKNRCFINVLVQLNDYTFASGADDKTIRIWDLNGNCIRTLTGFFQGHKAPISCVIELNDEIIASGDTNGTIKLWDKKDNCILTIKTGQTEIWELFELGNGTLASYSSDRTVKNWDRKGTSIKVLTIDSESLKKNDEIKNKYRFFTFKDGTSFLTCNNSRILKLRSGSFVSSDQENILLWDHQGNVIEIFKGHKSKVRRMLELKDGLVSSDESGNIILWDLKNGSRINLEGHNQRVDCLIELKNGAFVSSTEHAREIKIWDRKGNRLRTLHEEADGLLPLNDGNFICWTEKNQAIWDQNGRLIKNHENTFLNDGIVQDPNKLIQLKNGNLVFSYPMGHMVLMRF